jgi:hypothetical protein
MRKNPNHKYQISNKHTNHKKRKNKYFNIEIWNLSRCTGCRKAAFEICNLIIGFSPGNNKVNKYIAKEIL